MTEDEEDNFWFPLGDCPSDRAVVIVAELTRLSRAWVSLGVGRDDFSGFIPWPSSHPRPNLVLGVDLSVGTMVIRTFRVDLYSTLALVGEDDSKQFARDLDPASPDVVAIDGSASEVAARAASWIEAEMRRPVEVREWDVRDFCYRRWYLADTGQCILADNRIFRFVPEDLGPPDRVIGLRDANGPCR